MKSPRKEFTLGLTRAIGGAVLILVAVGTPMAHAATVWTGPTITYSQPGTDPTQPANQDRLTPKVWLTRATTQGLFNAVNESFYDKITKTRPSDTEWAYGELANHASLTYTTWAAMSGNNPRSMVGKQAVVHLISEDIYLSIRFTAWGGSAGGFAYTRSTPSPSPTVSITNPVNNAVFAAPANVTIAATAAVSSGSVTNVEFFANSTSLGSDQASPFSLTTGSLAAGDYALTAVATAAGISATSSVVNITVISLPTPTVSITNPANGAVFAAPANVTIGATATVSSGSVTNVEFFVNSTSLGSDPSPPFSRTTSNLAAGDYALTAVATAAGISATSSVVNITVISLLTPTVSITNPANGAVFAASANVTIGATATVSSGSVTNVEFFGNSTSLGSIQSPPFNLTTGNLAAGDYALTAVATAAGISATSSVVNITVISLPTPTVSITNPANGAVFAAPANVTIGATATVSSGSVTNVEFFANSTSLGSDQASPFSFTTGSLAAGDYALTAVATAAGISATSSVVNITVISLPTPTVSITNPANGAVFAAPANVTIGVTATVSSGSVSNVEFFGNSTSLGSVQSPPFNLTTGNLASGNYALNAVATAAGVSATSSVVSITVVSPVAVSVNAPIITNGQFSFEYTANPGLSYVVESSLNLVNWLPVATNVAAANPAHFNDTLVPDGSHFYRVGRLPNP